MRVCDGCGGPADEGHIRARIERLELATRFRPIHIQVLLLGDAPPVPESDYFYRLLRAGAGRSDRGKEFLAEVLIAAGIPRDAGLSEEGALTEFQRRGFYLAEAIECPVAPGDDLLARVQKAAPTLVKRIEFSYRPKHVAAIGEAVKRLVPSLASSPIADRFVGEDATRVEGATSPFSGAEIAAMIARLA
ncbi:MAG: hypothetical protein ACRD59_10580 [Candidatus Acidiferrales bacterium]